MSPRDLPRLNDEEREALESGYVALQGVPADDLSSLIQTFEALSRGAVSHRDQVLAYLKELEQRRAAGPMPPVGDEPDALAVKQIIRRIDSVNGVDVGIVCDALRQFVTLEDEANDGQPFAYPLIECIRSKLQEAKNQIERLCLDALP